MHPDMRILIERTYELGKTFLETVVVPPVSVDSNIAIAHSAPGDGFSNIFRTTVKAKPELIILATYESGMIPSSILPYIREATEAQIPVFAIPGSDLDDQVFELSQVFDQPGSWNLSNLENAAFPPAMAAGLVPLQGFPSEFFAMAASAAYFFGRGSSLSDDGSALFFLRGGRKMNFLMETLDGICKSYKDYQGRVDAARQALSTQDFNRRLDAQLRTYLESNDKLLRV